MPSILRQSRLNEFLRSYIITLLSSFGVMPRTDIVFYCNQSGFTEKRTGNALAKLYKEQRIFRGSVPRPKRGANSQDAHIYWIRFDNVQIEQCKGNVRRRLAIVDDTNILGETGEGYIRSLYFNIRAAERKQGRTRFGKITSPKKLGQISLLDGEADLKIPYSIPGATFSLLHEVKNQYYSVKQAQVKKLVRQAIENSTVKEILVPVMIASYIDQKTKELLTFNGVSFLELGRQILPVSLEAQIIGLYGVEMANDRFQFIAKRPLRKRRQRPTAKPPDPRTVGDIATLSNPRWIEAGASRWLSLLQKELLLDVK